MACIDSSKIEADPEALARELLDELSVTTLPVDVFAMAEAYGLDLVPLTSHVPGGAMLALHTIRYDSRFDGRQCRERIAHLIACWWLYQRDMQVDHVTAQRMGRALLMPAWSINAARPIRELAQRYDVHEFAVVRRLADLRAQRDQMSDIDPRLSP